MSDYFYLTCASMQCYSFCAIFLTSWVATHEHVPMSTRKFTQTVMSKLKDCTFGIYKEQQHFPFNTPYAPWHALTKCPVLKPHLFVWHPHSSLRFSLNGSQPSWFYSDGRSAQMVHSPIHATATITATIKRSTIQSDRLASIIVHHLFPDQPNSSIVMNLVCHLGYAAIPC